MARKEVFLGRECTYIWIIIVVVVCVDGFAISSPGKQRVAFITTPQETAPTWPKISTESQRQRTNSCFFRSNRKRSILRSTSSANSEPIFFNDFEDYNPHPNQKSVLYDTNNKKQEDNNHSNNKHENDGTWVMMTDARSVGGDWRAFRRSLTKSEQTPKQQRLAVAKQNEKVLESQNESLAAEYRSGVWAHETSTVCTYKHIYIYLQAFIPIPKLTHTQLLIVLLFSPK
jgi:hypothetical protein